MTRSSPSSPMSSSPGVSMITTGPRGRSSIAFGTGSVVVPRTSDTMARFCPVIALMMLDLPAFLRPKIPICTRSAEGVLLRLIVFVISFFVFFLRRKSFAVSLDLEKCFIFDERMYLGIFFFQVMNMEIVYHIYCRKSIL